MWDQITLSSILPQALFNLKPAYLGLQNLQRRENWDRQSVLKSSTLPIHCNVYPSKNNDFHHNCHKYYAVSSKQAYFRLQNI